MNGAGERTGRDRCQVAYRSARALTGVLLTAALLTGSAGVAHADDANHQQYSVLYGGNYSAADAHRFSYRLYYYGGAGSWVGKTQTSYDPRETDVAHWDLTNGWPGVDPWQGANQRDLVYLSTHGWPGQMRFYAPRWVGTSAANADWRRRIDQNRKNDNIGPRNGDLCGSNTYGWERNLWEIGATYKPYSVSRTNSRWNDDIEWIFLASCNQLSTAGESPGSRALYARTLLGEPNRAHSIMGYRSTAPGDATDVGIVDNLFNLLARGNSVRYSWLQANSLYTGSARNAAVVLHQKHLYEGLPPVSARQDDSPAGSTVAMQYWYLNSLGNLTGGPLASSESSFGSRILSAFSRWFGASEAIAEGAPRLIQGRETTFKVSAALPKAPRGVGPLVLAGERGRPEEIARGLMGGRFERSVDPTAGVETFAGNGRTLITFGGDGYLLEEPDEYGDEPVGMDQAEAVEVAGAYLAENGMLPDDALLSDVTGVMAASLDPLTGELSGESTSAYIVEYRHEFNGIPITGVEGDVISVVVASGGRVCQARNTWRQPSHTGRAVTLIDAEEALGEVVRDGERIEGLPGLVDVSEARLVYYSNRGNSAQNVMWPAWEFTLAGEGDEDGSAPARVFVDARTGRVVTD